MKRFFTLVFLLVLSFEVVFFVQQSEKIRALKAIPVVPSGITGEVMPDAKVAEPKNTVPPKIKRPSAVKSETAVDTNNQPKPVKRLLADRDYARELDRHLSESTVVNTLQSDQLTIDHKKSILYKALEKLPTAHQDAIKYLILKEEADPTRGLGGQNTMILHTGKLPDAELLSVFLHEMGHIVDTGLFRGTREGNTTVFNDGQNPVFDNDPSISFYEISWLSGSEKRPGTSSLDFVSGYARSDPFEDFAESYVMYVVHGRQFRSMLANSEQLRKKYTFLKNIVFGMKEYETGNELSDTTKRDYDATLEPFDLGSFLKVG